MAQQREIAIGEYAYELPDELVPRFPSPERGGSRLLVYRNGDISDAQFSSIADNIEPGSLVVFNNTRVIQARIPMQKETGAQIEIFCLEPHQPAEYSQAFSVTGTCQWHCMVGNLKKWKSGPITKELNIDGQSLTLSAEQVERCDKSVLIQFSWEPAHYHFAQILDAAGKLPIPPYLGRDTEASDYDRYQTVYSQHKGSVAAPTAGLHFTETVFSQLRSKNIQLSEVTLHVGAGTFRPVQSETLGGHDMHTEHFHVSRAFLQQLRGSLGQVVAVGTTSVRTIESLYWLAADLERGNRSMKVEQWSPYDNTTQLEPRAAIDVLLRHCDEQETDTIHASTCLMIAPGYRWQFVNRIVTNFHQPESTLLLLVSAYTGGDWTKIYSHAIAQGYRFLSYGDSSILINEPQ